MTCGRLICSQWLWEPWLFAALWHLPRATSTILPVSPFRNAVLSKAAAETHSDIHHMSAAMPAGTLGAALMPGNPRGLIVTTAIIVGVISTNDCAPTSWTALSIQVATGLSDVTSIAIAGIPKSA